MLATEQRCYRVSASGIELSSWELGPEYLFVKSIGPGKTRAPLRLQLIREATQFSRSGVILEDKGHAANEGLAGRTT